MLVTGVASGSEALFWDLKIQKSPIFHIFTQFLDFFVIFIIFNMKNQPKPK